MSMKPDIDIGDLPGEIPLFPLGGVLLLPGGQLPLNIFEERYIAMIDDALSGTRLIGMLQPKSEDESQELFNIGCAGKITSFEEQDDGRYIITLTGICRFELSEELALKNGYRRAQINWNKYQSDLNRKQCLDLDRQRLKDLLQNYFSMQEISCDWDAIDGASDQKLITCLSMICPFDAGEKQALLEAECCNTRADMFLAMLEMAINNGHALSGECH